MKKIVAILLTVILVFSLIACDNGDTPSGSEGVGGSSQNQGGGSKPSGGGTTPTEKIDSYADVYALFEKVTGAMESSVNNIVDANNAKLEQEKPDSYYNDPSYLIMMYMPFMSLDMAFSSMISDDVSPSTIEMTYAFLGSDADFTVLAPGDYKLTYNTTDWQDETQINRYEERMLYSGESIRYAQYKNGELDEFTEFISLGNDRYAIQNRTNRAVLTYKDGVITEMVHSWTIWDEDWETDIPTPESIRYDLDADSSWGRKDQDENWVRELEAQNRLERIYVLRNGTLTISGMKSSTDWETNVTTYTAMDPIVIAP